MDATPEPTPPPTSRPASRPTPPTFGRRRLLGLVGVVGVGAAGAVLIRPRTDRVALAASSTPATTGLVSSTDPATTSTTSAPTTTSTLAPPTGVAMLGDSITYLSDAALRRAIAPVASLSLVGRVGYTISQLLPDAEAAALKNPAAVVIDLGTNDALNAVTRAASVSALDSLLDLFPRATPVLVTVSTHFGDAACVARAKAINAHIRGLGVAVADWDATVGAELAAGLPDGPITLDDVHPTARGQKVLAGLIARMLPRSVFTA